MKYKHKYNNKTNLILHRYEYNILCAHEAN